MNIARTHCLKAMLAVLLASALVACGGGSDAPAPPGPLAPSITAQPANQSVAAGGTASFSVSASGDAPLSYQWQRNGVDIAGASSSTFTLGNVLVPDQGATFAAKVGNGAGTATSATAVLSVVPAGTLTLVAGSLAQATATSPLPPSALFVNGPAASATFGQITGLALDKAGNIFVTDTFNTAVRKISTEGVVTTFAGPAGLGAVPAGLAIDSADTLYLADGFPPSFGVSWFGVKAISPQGAIRPFAQLSVFTASLTVDVAGNVYVPAPARRISPSGEIGNVDLTAAPQSFVYGNAIAADGTYYFAVNNAIWKNPVGFGSVLHSGASSPGTADGPAQQARFQFAGTGIPVPKFQLPMVADSTGNLYLCDDNNLRRVAKDGSVTTLTGRAGMLAGVAVAGLQDKPFSCDALALRGDKTLYIGRGGLVLKLQLP